MTSALPNRTSAPASLDDAAGRRGRLALALQEPLTTVARLRSNKQVASDAESFRTRIKQVLSAAEQDARAIGYEGDDVRFALFSVIAFLDETVLNSGQPMFAQWPGRTLQQEVFGVHMAGELFFQYLQQLMERQDSADLADILEVFELCLLMGFKGRYSATQGGDVASLVHQLSEKIQRIRGPLGELSPRWRPPQDEIGRRRDRWVPRLAVLAVVTVVLAVGLFAYFTVSLRSGMSDLKTETARLPH
jgi:type VI secretion system protein ImpK